MGVSEKWVIEEVRPQSYQNHQTATESELLSFCWLAHRVAAADVEKWFWLKFMLEKCGGK